MHDYTDRPLPPVSVLLINVSSSSPFVRVAICRIDPPAVGRETTQKQEIQKTEPKETEHKPTERPVTEKAPTLPPNRTEPEVPVPTNAVVEDPTGNVVWSLGNRRVPTHA